MTKSLCNAYETLFPIGAAVNPPVIKTHAELLKTHYNSITAENEMKFGAIHPKENTYDFEKADTLVDFAVENNMKMRGHCFVWHQQNPDWLFVDSTGQNVSREVLLERLEQHINTLTDRYHEHVYCWDVVNEAIEDKGSEYLRQTKWLEIIGEDYIEKAFELAHKADPNALLFYNDYNEMQTEKRQKIIKLVKSLKEKGTPIHGIGLQGHWNIHTPSLDEIRTSIEEYAMLGLKLQITELDISVFAFDDHTKLTEPTAEMVERQATMYEGAFKIFREYSDVITGVTFWGVADDRTWLDYFPVKDRKNWPLLFDIQHKPKKVFERIVEF